MHIHFETLADLCTGVASAESSLDVVWLLNRQLLFMPPVLHPTVVVWGPTCPGRFRDPDCFGYPCVQSLVAGCIFDDYCICPLQAWIAELRIGVRQRVQDPRQLSRDCCIFACCVLVGIASDRWLIRPSSQNVLLCLLLSLFRMALCSCTCSLTD